jgi:hypothetical protein
MADQMLSLLQSMEKSMASMSHLMQASIQSQKPTYKQAVQKQTNPEVHYQWRPVDPEKKADPVRKRVAEIKQSVLSSNPMCMRCGDK